MEVTRKAKLGIDFFNMRRCMTLVDFASSLSYSEKGIEVKLKYEDNEADPRSIMDFIRITSYLRLDSELEVIAQGNVEESELERAADYLTGFLEQDFDKEEIQDYVKKILEEDRKY